ncbi:MAG: hypothetical protein ACPGF7_10640 [Pontibacterium sp.]
MNNLQNEPLAELNTDEEVEKYSYAAAARELGHEPFPVIAADAGGLRLPQTDADEYFASLADAARQFGDVAAETGRVAVAGVRQPLQEAINTGIDWFGMQMKEFYKVNGFASDEQVDAILPESMLQHLNDKGINTELPLKHIAPNTELGITARELTAYATGFLMTMGRGQAKQAGESVIDYLGRHSHNLLRAIRGNTGGAMALNVEESNLSDLAIELGFDEELRAYFAEGSVADTAAEGVADELAIRANPKLEEGTQLTAEGRLARKLDTVLEDNALGAMFAVAILTAAKGFKLAKAAPKTTALGTSAAVAGTSSDAESMPVGQARGLIDEAPVYPNRSSIPMTEDFRVFPKGVDLGDGSTVKQVVDEDELGFYSQAMRAVNGLGMDKMTSQQARRMLAKAGVKPEEMEWTGLNDLLDSGDQITKEMMQTHLQNNRIQLKEIELPEATELEKNDAYYEAEEAYVQIDRDVMDMSDNDIDTDRENWAYRIEDFESELNISGTGSGSVDQYTMASLVQNLWEEAGSRYPSTAVQDTSNLGYRFVTPKDGVDVANGDWAVELQEAMEEHGADAWRVLQERDPDFWQDIDTDVEEALERIAEIDYMNSPYYSKTVTIGDQEFNIHGSSDVGFIVRDESGNTIIDDVYSLAEVSIQLRDTAVDRGLLEFPIEGDTRISGKAQWGEHTEEGGENYREMLLINDNYKGDPAYRMGDDGASELHSFRVGAHYDESNIIFHTRVKDRVAEDGGKVLYVEELQSDWAQRGRDNGFYMDNPRPPETVEIELADIEQQMAVIKNAAPNEVKGIVKRNIADLDLQLQGQRLETPILPPKSPDIKGDPNWEVEKSYPKVSPVVGESGVRALNLTDWDYAYAGVNKEYRALMAKRKKLKTELKANSVPRGPLVQSTDKWTAFALKRLMRYAADNGYDYLAFSPGVKQYDRWRNKGLITFYDEIIPKVTNQLLKKMDNAQGDLFSGMDLQMGHIKIPELTSDSIRYSTPESEYPNVMATHPSEFGFRNAIRISDVSETTSKGQSLFTPGALVAGTALAAANSNMRQQAKTGKQQPAM